jgi:MFS family permease
MATGISIRRENRTAVSGRPERLFVSATFITMLGNNIQLIATSLLVYRTAGSALAVGWVFILTAIPQALFSALFGRIADHVDRRRLCLVADLGSALTAVALPVAIVFGASPSGAGYVISFILALFASIFMPASNALFKERLPRERLGHFSSNYEIGYQGGALLSGVLGGFVAQLVGVTPLFYFNAATFVGSAVCILAVGRRAAAAGASATPAAQAAAEAADAAEAAAEAAAPAEPAATTHPEPGAPDGRRPILRLALLYAVGTVLITVENTLLLVAIVHRFHEGAALLGVTDALAGIGMLAAATLYKKIKDRADYRYLITAVFLSCAVLTAIQPIAVWTLLPCILLCGVSFGLGRVPARTEIMRAVDPDRAGRTFGAANAFGLAASVAATVVVATIVGHHGVVPGFLTLALIGGVPVVVIGVSLMTSRIWAPVPASSPTS